MCALIVVTQEGQSDGRFLFVCFLLLFALFLVSNRSNTINDQIRSVGMVISSGHCLLLLPMIFVIFLL